MNMKMENHLTRDHILARIEAFLETWVMSEREFGLRAVSEHRFISRLRDRNIGVTLTGIEKAESFMQKIEAGTSEAA